jgi:hypothetical protein
MIVRAGGVGDVDHHVTAAVGLAFEFGDPEGSLSSRGGGCHCVLASRSVTGRMTLWLIRPGCVVPELMCGAKAGAWEAQSS